MTTTISHYTTFHSIPSLFSHISCFYVDNTILNVYEHLCSGSFLFSPYFSQSVSGGSFQSPCPCWPVFCATLLHSLMWLRMSGCSAKHRWDIGSCHLWSLHSFMSLSIDVGMSAAARIHSWVVGFSKWRWSKRVTEWYPSHSVGVVGRLEFPLGWTEAGLFWTLITPPAEAKTIQASSVSPSGLLPLGFQRLSSL